MTSQPIARPPAERTLFVAILLLCLVAFVQIVAAVIALVPRIDYDGIARAMESRGTAAAQAPAPPSTPAVDAQAVKAQQINSLLADAKQFEAARNFRGALQAYSEAARLDPNKPDLLYAIAQTQYELRQPDDSIATLKALLALPAAADPANADYVAKARNALTQLTAAAAAATPRPGDSAMTTESGDPASAAAPSTQGDAPPAAAAMRDDVGIPIGSVMGIVNVELLNGEPGHKNLRVSIKAASGQKTDPAKVHATVDFYEQDDQGQIQRNTAPSPSEWLSSPVDWAESAPELFQVKYRLPVEEGANASPAQYYGYVVAIYYDGELQDQRADPPSLLEQNAPPLHKDLPTE